MDCSFCGEEVPQGKGKIYITSDGKRYPYCSSKCEKNHRKLERDPKKTEWVKNQ